MKAKENGIRRGTTPMLTCKILDDVDYSTFKTVWLTFKQGDVIVLDKLTEDVTINENNIAIRLTQEDTLALTAGVPLYIQIRILTEEDEIAYASQMEFFTVEDVEKDGVIV